MGFQMVEQVVLHDELPAGDVHEDRVVFHLDEEPTVHEALRGAGQGEREDDDVRLGQISWEVVQRADLIGEAAREPRPRDPDDAHVERLAARRDLGPDAPEAEDHDRGAGEAFVHDALIEHPATDLIRATGDIFRGGEEEGHRMLRDRDVVRARVAADDRRRGESLERQMVDAGHEGLDHPHLPRLLPEVGRKFPRKAHRHDDVRGRPSIPAFLSREIVQDHGLERPRGLPRHDLAALRVHRSDEQDAGHRATRDLRGTWAFRRGRSALRVPARVALDAAFLEDEGLAALRALRVQAFPQQFRGVARLLLQFDAGCEGASGFAERLDGRLDAGLLHPDVSLDRLRDRVGDRVDALSVVDRDPRAPDALELVDDLVDRDAGPQAQRHEPGDPFREGRRVAAAAADLREDLEEAFLVLVDGDVEGAVSREDLLRAARDHVRAGAGPQGRRLRGNFDADRLRLLRLRDPDVQDLVLARAVAVHGNAFALELVGEEVRLLHILDGGLARQVDRLRDRSVAVILERGLHTDVPLGCDVVCRGEHALPFLRDLLQSPRRSVVVEDLLHEVRLPEALALRDLLEVFEEVGKLLSVHYALVPNQAELRLAAAGCVSDHRERAGGRDGRDVGIADMQALLLVTAPLPSGIDSALFRELCALIISGFMDKSHTLAAPFDPLLGVVLDLEHEEHAGEAHDTEADLSGRTRHLLDLLDGVRIHVDDIVEHANRRTDGPFELLPVDIPTTAGVALHVPREIDGTKVA